MLTLSRSLYDEMVTHLRACYPEEGCGLLSGRDGMVTAVIPIANVLRSRTRFLMDPAEQVAGMLAIVERDEDLLAIYHSHPHSAPYPSATDKLEHAYPEAYAVIVSLVSDPPQAGLYRIKNNEVTHGDIFLV